MFLKCSQRRKGGKVHRVVESRRHAGRQVTQRHVLYLGEINDSQRRAWEKTITVFDEAQVPRARSRSFPLIASRRSPLVRRQRRLRGRRRPRAR
ncbi:MAG: hypothetical protein ABIY47_03245 [Opitutaceae bacterium]